MPWYPVNTFRPLTPVGEGIQNVSRLLFGGATGDERALKQQQAAQAAAHSDLFRAQADALRSKAAAEAAARADMEAAPARIVGGIFGSQPKADLWMQSRKTGTQAVDDFTTPIGSQMGPTQQQPEPMPAQFDPAQVAKAVNLLTAVDVAKALPGNDNMAHLAKLLIGMEEADARAGINAGKVDPTRIAQGFFATSGKAPFDNMGGTGTFNQVTGDQALNALGNAKVASEGALAGERRAAAGAHGAAAGASNALRDQRVAQTNQLKEDVLVPVIDPDTGLPKLDSNNAPVMIRQSDRGKALQRTAGRVSEQDNKDANKAGADAWKDAKAKPIRTVKGSDKNLFEKEFKDLAAEQGMDWSDVDGETKGQMQRAVERMWQAGAPGHSNAVKAAWDEVAPGGVEKSGVYGFRKLKPAGGAAAPAAAGLPSPKSQAEYDRLPPGSRYIGTDGQEKVKGNKRNADGSVGS